MTDDEYAVSLFLSGYDEEDEEEDASISSPTHLKKMAKLIRLFTNIRYLRVDGMDRPLAHSRHLMEAITSLFNVQEIDCRDINGHIVNLLRGMHSPVVRATLQFRARFEREERGDDDDETVHRDPLLMLQAFQSHLTHLQVDWLEELDLWEDTTYRKLRTLILRSHEFDLEDLDADKLAASTPNLREFTWEEDEDLDRQIAERIREKNLEDRDPNIHVQGWQSLDRLSCSIPRTCSMALTCRVRLWDHLFIPDPNPTRLRQFQLVLSDIRPTFVDLMVVVNPLTALDLECLSDIFGSSIVSITHLRLMLWLKHHRNEDDEIEIFDYPNKDEPKLPLSSYIHVLVSVPLSMVDRGLSERAKLLMDD